MSQKAAAPGENQENCITLSEAMNRTNYWRQAVKHLYDNNQTKMPHGFFIPIADIIELSQLAQTYPEHDIVGVRAYFTFHKPQPIEPPYTEAITAILVPVHLSVNEATGNILPVAQELDLIVPIMPGAQNDPDPVVSVYDVTQPCPAVCDTSSFLF